MSRRTERVAELVRAEIARILRQEITDPRIGLVTLTGVDVSPDLLQARVGWSRIEADGSAPLESVQRGLESAAPFIRRRLAAALALRRVPELRFRHDPSLEQGSATLALIESLRSDDEEPDPEDGSQGPDD